MAGWVEISFQVCAKIFIIKSSSSPSRNSSDIGIFLTSLIGANNTSIAIRKALFAKSYETLRIFPLLSNLVKYVQIVLHSRYSNAEDFESIRHIHQKSKADVVDSSLLNFERFLSSSSESNGSCARASMIANCSRPVNFDRSIKIRNHPLPSHVQWLLKLHPSIIACVRCLQKSVFPEPASPLKEKLFLENYHSRSSF